jgi:regulatory protein
MSGKPLDAASLYEAAIHYMARYAATEAGLARILARKIERWGKMQADGIVPEDVAQSVRQAKSEIPGIVNRLKELGVVNDQAFALSRSKRLIRGGKSHRATLAHLSAKGIKNPALKADPAHELAAACAYLRRRRAGPFGPAPANKILAAMARGGFSPGIARRAMALDLSEAENLIQSLSTE